MCYRKRKKQWHKKSTSKKLVHCFSYNCAVVCTQPDSLAWCAFTNIELRKGKCTKILIDMWLEWIEWNIHCISISVNEDFILETNANYWIVESSIEPIMYDSCC